MTDLLLLRDQWLEQHPRPASKATYERHLRTFIEWCEVNEISQVEQLTDQVLLKYPPTLIDQQFAGSSISVKIVALKDFLGFAEDHDLITLRWARLERQWKRMPKPKRHQVLLDHAGIEHLIEYCLAAAPEDLIDARNFAFVVWQADTGLRVGEACSLKRGDIDWKTLHGVVIGKREKQAAFRISERAARLMQRYLTMRAQMDGSSGIPLHRLPLFARHDDAVGKKIEHMTTTTGRNITKAIVEKVLGDQADPDKPITPHKFRHYLIDRARRRGGLDLAQGIGRHENIAVTQRYFHLDDQELDEGYRELFEQA